MAQQVHLRAAGLYLDPSPLAPVPDGAMLEAQNVVIRRPGIIEPRPTLEPATRPSYFDSKYAIQKIFPYKGSRIVITDYDNANSKVASWTDNQEIVDESSASITTTAGQRSAVETSRALYFTTDKGVRRLNEPSDATARLAGMPVALSGWCYDDGAATYLWLPTATAVAYRVVWVRRVEGQDLYSAPSQRFLCFNFQSPAADAGPVVGIPIPPDIIATDRLQIYRSAYVSGSTEPPDDMRLLEEIEMTSSDISAGIYTYADPYDEAERVGAYLYTNADQEGALQANVRPPHARCIAEYNGMMFYGGAQGPHELTVTLVEGLMSFGSGSPTIAVTSGVATFTVTAGTAANLAVGMYVTDNLSGDFTAAGTVFAASTQITNISGTTITVSPVPIGTSGAASVDFGGVLRIDSTDHKGTGGFGASGEFNDVSYANGNFFRWGITTPTAAAYVPWGLQNLAASINAYDPTCYAVASSGVSTRQVSTGFGYNQNNADRQATLTILRRDMADTAFSVYTTNPGHFTGESLDWTTAVTSTYGGGPSRLAWSKKGQHDTAPPLQFQDLGHEDYPILAMHKAGESLFVFKTDGVWRVTGESPDTLRIEEFDRELILVHPEAACAFRDEVYCWTNRGLVALSNGGVRDFGNMQLKSTLRGTAASLMQNLLKASSPYASSATQMWASEARDEIYLLTRAYAAEDAEAAYCYVFNFHTGAWVRWTFNSDYHNVYSGAWDHVNGLILFGGDRRDTASDSMLMEESVEGFTREHDLFGFDESFTVSVSAISGSTWTVGAHATYIPKVGDLIGYGGTFVGRVTAAASATSLTVETISGTVPTPTVDVTMYGVNRAVLKWHTEHAGVPAIRKHWRDVLLLTEDWYLVPPTTVAFAGDGLVSGSISMGTYSANETRVFRGSAPRNVARCAQMTVQATIDYASTVPYQITGLGLTFEPESERFRWR